MHYKERLGSYKNNENSIKRGEIVESEKESINFKKTA